MAANPGYLNGIDDATATLILELQLADLKIVQGELKGKNHPGKPTDAEYALSLYSENLKGAKTLLSDRRMTQSIRDAVQSDGELIASAVSEEELAYSDRVFAGRLSGRTVVSKNTTERSKIDDLMLSKLAGMYVSDAAGLPFLQADTEKRGGSAGEPSSSHGKPVQVNQEPVRRRCEACIEFKNYFDVVTVPCGHEYCRECIHELFEAAMTDETLFPPRCCRQHMTIESVGLFLTWHLRARFEEKKIEFSTTDRTYCNNTACSSFIRTSEIRGDVATCMKCGSKTCSICKAAGHAGECPKDTALQALMDLANQEKWQRCFKCRGIVELDTGCNHITCRCGAEFCYICAENWKVCRCAQWDEDRLYARANVLVDRGPGPEGAIDRVNQVQRAAEMLRRRHNCTHRNWEFIRAASQCEECHHMLPMFIFQCVQCQIRVCKRCKDNRLS